MTTSSSRMTTSLSSMTTSPLSMTTPLSSMTTPLSSMTTPLSSMITSLSSMITSPPSMTTPVVSGSSSHLLESSVLDLRKHKTPYEELTIPLSPVLGITKSVLAAINDPNTRPFRAYTKSHLPIDVSPEYAKYRAEMLPKLQSARERTRRKRPPSEPTPTVVKDEAYWKRRRKNNESAKQSRTLRRAKEDELALHAAVLEEENLKLKQKVLAVSEQNVHLKGMMYQNANHPTHHMFSHPPMAFLPTYPSMI